MRLIPAPAKDVAEGPGTVAGTAIGHHPLNLHPVGGDDGNGLGHDGRGGGLGFIGQDLGVHVAGMVVDGVVDEGVALTWPRTVRWPWARFRAREDAGLLLRSASPASPDSP